MHEIAEAREIAPIMIAKKVNTISSSTPLKWTTSCRSPDTIRTTVETDKIVPRAPKRAVVKFLFLFGLFFIFYFK